ncbi:MAG TPA: recombinase family protein [Chloroflexota bacterium]
MLTSELVQPHHLSRQAVIYIRQSSPNQVLTHQESLRLQHALRQRAEQLGWSPANIQVIDADLGQTARTIVGRSGFQELVTRVSTDQVGIIFSYEVTRLARNCTDWYPLLDVCGFRRCLIADCDGVYDPGSVNGRLILGLKGQISELELHTIRNRLHAALLQKAERGELAQVLPAGLVRDEAGIVRKDPHQEVQSRIALIFTAFQEQRATTKVVRFLRQHHLRLPRKNRWGEIVWRWPTTSAIASILQNPAYAGAYVRGRTQTYWKNGKPLQRRLPLSQWKICLRDQYPAYISWEQFEKNQTMLQDNYSEYDRNRTRGIPRSGKALLHGLVCCGQCGHKMVVQYKGGTQYLCNQLRGQYQVPVCQRLPADPIDDWVVHQFLAAFAGAELDLYALSVQQAEQEQQQVAKAHQQQLQRLHYEAELAERQFRRADPENRLVTAELERRWEQALRAVAEAEELWRREETQRSQVQPLTPQIRQALEQAGEQLPELWGREDFFSQAQRKALLRCLIDKVVVHRIAADCVHARIVWRGGDTTMTDIPVSVGSMTRLSFAEDMGKAILQLARQGQSDEQIADHLTSQGYRSPQRSVVLPSTVQNIRLRHGLMVKRSQSHPRRIAGFLTLSQIAERLQVSPHWIYDRIHNGTIQVSKDPEWQLYLFPDKPSTLTLFRKLRDGKVKNLRF